MCVMADTKKTANLFTSAGFREADEFSGWVREGYRVYDDPNEGWSVGFTFPDGIERIVGACAKTPEQAIAHVDDLIRGAQA
jgi:hypothetical protein